MFESQVFLPHVTLGKLCCFSYLLCKMKLKILSKVTHRNLLSAVVLVSAGIQEGCVDRGSRLITLEMLESFISRHYELSS